MRTSPAPAPSPRHTCSLPRPQARAPVAPRLLRPHHLPAVPRHMNELVNSKKCALSRNSSCLNRGGKTVKPYSTDAKSIA
jgi:hypothetical protein